MNRRIFARLMPSKLPLSDYADDIMEAEDFREYVGTHGYHFTCKLAEDASKMLKNADGSSHKWSCEEVMAAVGNTKNGHTLGDATFLANQIYSDYYPRSITAEPYVITATKEMLEDEDGYEGMIFLRWVSDLIGRGDNVKWDKYI